MFIVSTNNNHPFCIDCKQILVAKYHYRKRTGENPYWSLEVHLRGVEKVQVVTWVFEKKEDVENTFNEMMKLIPESQKTEESK